VSLKSLTTGVAAATLVGAAAVGVTSVASVPITVSPAITPVVFGAPLPLDSDPALTGEFTGILNQLANSGSINGNLIDGGVGIIEARTADQLLKNAAAKGYLPLNISVDPNSITESGNTASATVTASGPALAPTTQTVTFVNNGGWKLSKGSATALLQAAMASG